MEQKKEIRDDFLFGKEGELIIRRCSHGSTHRGYVYIGDRNLVGVTKLKIEVDPEQPIKYWVEGEVVQ